MMGARHTQRGAERAGCPCRPRLGALRRLLALLAAALVFVCAADTATALAGTSYVNGISDQNLGNWSGNYVAGSYDAPLYDLFTSTWVGSPPSHLGYARFVTAPDTVAQGGECEQNLVNWYEYVTQTLHLIPVISVWNVAEGGCANNGRPSTAAYTTDMQQLIAFLAGLDGGAAPPYIEAWNEPNSDGVSAALGAAYWLAANSLCSTDGCTVVAGDLVDNDPDQGGQAFSPGCTPNLTWNNFAAYETNYVSALGAARPSIWGMHPYYAVNCEQSGSVTTFDENLPSPSGAVWFTEVGAWECVNGQSPARGVTQQEDDASYLVDTLMSPLSTTDPAVVFYYEFAPLGYTQDCAKYTDSALYEANTAPGALAARPAAATIYGQDSTLAASTGAATRTGTTAATINGVVTPGGIYAASYHFDYGPTSAYGFQTPAIAVGPGVDAKAVSAQLSGLTPNAGYDYELVVTDANGMTEYGGDQKLAGATLTASPSDLAAGGQLAVTWADVSPAASSDWIGLYQPGAAASSSLGGFYDDSCGASSNGSTVASGSCGYAVAQAGGVYELRLYSQPGGGGALLASSNQITVPTLTVSPSSVTAGGTVTASWSDVGTPAASDWIGLYAPGAPPGSRLSWLYDDSCTQTSSGAALAAGSCSYPTPVTAGTYQLRLYADGGTSLLATSSALTTSAATAVPLAAVAPAISGGEQADGAVVGNTLTCSTGTWSGDPTGYAFAWELDGVANGATASTYPVQAGDAGRSLACAVTASNAGGAGTPATSAAIAVAPPPPTPIPAAQTTARPLSSGAPSILGSVIVGDTLSESHAAWTGMPTAFAYQWQRCNAAGAECRATPRAGAATYTLTAADVGSTIRVIETASNGSGAGSPDASAVTAVARAAAPVTPAPPGTALAAVSIDSTRHRAHFSFHSSGVATGFQCALVRRTGHHHTPPPRAHYTRCGRSVSFVDLRPGRYLLRVRAVGPGGADPTPISRRFTIA
jgi:hypothetical protein